MPTTWNPSPAKTNHPYFIVNMLNSIRFTDQAAKFNNIWKMAVALVSIASCSFRRSVSLCTVRKEADMPKTYVYLLRIRYSNDFEISYDGQPGVENSVTHGSGEMDEALGQIRTSVYQANGFLCLAVSKPAMQ